MPEQTEPNYQDFCPTDYIISLKQYFISPNFREFDGLSYQSTNGTRFNITSPIPSN